MARGVISNDPLYAANKLLLRFGRRNVFQKKKTRHGYVFLSLAALTLEFFLLQFNVYSFFRMYLWSYKHINKARMYWRRKYRHTTREARFSDSGFERLIFSVSENQKYSRHYWHLYLILLNVISKELKTKNQVSVFNYVHHVNTTSKI